MGNKNMELVYGIYRLDGLVFMPLGEARDRA